MNGPTGLPSGVIGRKRPSVIAMKCGDGFQCKIPSGWGEEGGVFDGGTESRDESEETKRGCLHMLASPSR